MTVKTQQFITIYCLSATCFNSL